MPRASARRGAPAITAARRPVAPQASAAAQRKQACRGVESCCTTASVLCPLGGAKDDKGAITAARARGGGGCATPARRSAGELRGQVAPRGLAGTCSCDGVAACLAAWWDMQSRSGAAWACSGSGGPEERVQKRTGALGLQRWTLQRWAAWRKPGPCTASTPHNAGSPGQRPSDVRAQGARHAGERLWPAPGARAARAVGAARLVRACAAGEERAAHVPSHAPRAPLTCLA